MFRLEMRRSVSVAVKLLLYRRTIFGMSCCEGLQMQQKKCHQGMLWLPSANEYEWPLSSIVSCPAEWRNQGRDCRSILTLID